jgi:hypothetical protein
MRTLQEKYNGIQEGKFSKEHFLAEARMQQPQLITRFNGYDDAVQILKNRGMIQEAVSEVSSDTFKGAVDAMRGRGENQRISNLGSTFLHSFIGKPLVGGTISHVDVQKPSFGKYFDVRLEVLIPTEEEGRQYQKPTYFAYDVDADNWNMKGVGLEITRQDARLLSQIAMKVNPDTKYKNGIQHFDIKGLNEAKLTKKSLTDYRYKPTNDMDKYPYEQILRGLRVELETAGVYGTPTPEEYTKALAKVSKNLEKDSIFYTNQVAGVNPKVDLHDKMVPFTEKAAVDTFNGMKKAELKEGFKKLIKKVLSEEVMDVESYKEEVYEMYGEDEDDIDYDDENFSDPFIDGEDDFFEGDKSLSELLK